MINVGVGKHHDINAGAVAETFAVEFKCLFAFTLKEPAVKHNPVTVYIYEMLGPCDGSCRAVKCYFHVFPRVERCPLWDR